MTRALGFGPHGQGQTMALAAFAQGDSGRLSPILSARSFDDLQVDERAAQSYAQRWLRSDVGDETSRRAALAADLQCSLEDVLGALALDGQSRAPSKHWAVAGGVALNCRANQRIADAVGGHLWVPSAPHDAGTALGAALEAMAMRGETLPGPLLHAGLGPAFSTVQCAEALKQVGIWEVAYEASVEDAAQCLARGGVMGWFDGPLEFGPRALGHRSIVAHPGLPGVAGRVNRMKERQRWRPFGPSVLAGEASAYFETDDFGPFMTRAVRVKPQCHDQVREVMHVDGTTRPQSVGRDAPEPYRALIEAFYDLTDIPMVLNTSFNRRGQPIVCNPADAIATAVAMGLDALWMAGLIVPLSELGRR